MDKAKVVIAFNAPDIPKLIARLEEHGVEISQTLDSIGVITGTISVEGNEIAELKKIDGVLHIAVDHHVRIPPPNSPIQ